MEFMIQRRPTVSSPFKGWGQVYTCKKQTSPPHVRRTGKTMADELTRMVLYVIDDEERKIVPREGDISREEI